MSEPKPAGASPVDLPLGAGAEAKKPTAQLDWSLYVYCPKCSEANDLASAEHDVDHDIARHIFSNDWHKLEGLEVTCGHCGHEFALECVVY